jgi:hypothetical protein
VAAPPANAGDRPPDESEFLQAHRASVTPIEQNEGSEAPGGSDQQPELGRQAEMEAENADPQKRINIADLMMRLGGDLQPQELSPESLRALKDIERLSAEGYKRIMRIAGRMETREEFISRLPELIRELGAEIPEGVLQPPRGKAGRPSSTTTGNIHAEWVKMGKPMITATVCDPIAKQFFPGELKGIARGSAQHRRIRERVRQAIRRCEQRIAT